MCKGGAAGIRLCKECEIEELCKGDLAEVGAPVGDRYVREV